MTDLYRVTHEVGDFSEYTATIDNHPGGGLSVSTSAGMVGTNLGLQAQSTGSSSEQSYAYVTISPPASNLIRFRYYADPNNLPLATDGSDILLHTAITANAPFSSAGFFTASFAKVGADYYFSFSMTDDLTGSNSRVVLAGQSRPYAVEVELVRASSDVAADGSMRIWLDNVEQTPVQNIDNYDSFASMAAYTAGVVFASPTASGSIYLDEIVIRDHSLHIGPRSVRSWFGPGWGM